MKYTAVKGMYDILPPESDLWQIINSKAKEVFSTYGYKEILTPIVEKTPLFVRSVGESTSIVEKEMYSFEDRNGDPLTLRPEGTASVVRAYVQNKVYAEEPIAKFYYSGPMFRYERPQKGRNRQFYQIGVEAFGVDSALIDAETISMGNRFLAELGLAGYKIEINSLGCPECRPTYLEKFENFLDKVMDDLCDDCKRRAIKNPMRVLDCKEEKCGKLLKDAPLVGDYLCKACDEHFERVKGTLEGLNVDFIVNQKIVRGLDYYMRTAFEITTDKLGAQNAILAGGRYDGLVKGLDGPDIPGIGFALGVERLSLLLMQEVPEVLPKVKEPVFFALLCEDAVKRVMPIIDTIRRDGVIVELDYACKSLKSQMRRADKLHSHSVVIIGEEELKNNKAVIRDMKSKEQIEVAIDKIPYRFVEIGG
ncbi:histidine--tRNA ligase [bacterium]|nr:histidine--tRNA ligase [bacterium]